MAFFRIKSIKSTQGKHISYLYLVKNHWDKEKQQSRQKVVLYIGKVEGLESFNIKGVYEAYDGKCKNCGRMDTLTISHILPLSRGGTNDLYNLQVLCKRCKSKEHLVEIKR